MPEYLYHGSPVKLTELKEPYEGRGVYLTPSRALAGMFGVMRDVKRKTNGFGHRWTMDLFDDYDKTGNDKPRAFTAFSDIEDMPETRSGADVYIHKIKVTPEIAKKLHGRIWPKTSTKHEVIYDGGSLPVASVSKVYIPYTAKYSPDVAVQYSDLVKSGASRSYEDALSVYNSLPPESQQYLSHHDTYVDSPDNLLYRVVKKNKTGLPLGFMDVYKHEGSKDNGFVVVGVRPEYQGKGIGSGLLQKAIEKAEARNMDNLVWGCMNFNEPSKKLALSVGGKKYKDIGDYELYNIPVKKKLSKEGIHKAARLKRTQMIRKYLRDNYD